MNKIEDIELDDPQTTLIHRDIILNKPFLKRIYLDWYQHFLKIAKTVENDGIVLELGSGGGFLKSIFPEVITSDIQQLDGVDMVCNAENLPFEDESIACILMLNVFHHIPRPYLFLQEAQRTLVKSGRIVMIEPANTLFSRFIYKNFHHEPFNPKGEMEISQGNPLSNSNQAFPYIYFIRERTAFEQNYKNLKIRAIKYHTPFRYILSGGLSHKSLAPNCLYGTVAATEKILSPLSPQLGLFCTIEIEKTD
ncbi:MAG: class I SAM-dependent methyltransferase [Tannerella sp.]|jgi:SAM-dependent methyltransferase|nr:class I SAM-dependent methyltransferase [Tannerella sp.]